MNKIDAIVKYSCLLSNRTASMLCIRLAIEMYKITGIPLRCCSYFTRDCHDCHVYCLLRLLLRPPGCLANQSTKTIFGPDRDYSHRTQNSWEKAQPNPYSSIDRLPRFKNIFAPSFHHSSNILIDQSCSPKACRQPSTGRLQSSLMIWY